MEDFEKDIKDFFQRREIKPSADAWQRMENLLSEPQAKQKPVKIYYLLSVAASVLLFVGLWVVFQKEDQVQFPETKPTEQFVVNEPADVPPVKATEKYESKEKKQFAKHSNLKFKSTVNTATAIATHKEPIVSKLYLPTEKNEVVSVYDIKEKPLIAANSHVEIKVDAKRLLESAEIERKMNKAMPEEKSIIKDPVLLKLIKEKHNKFLGNFTNTVEIE